MPFLTAAGCRLEYRRIAAARTGGPPLLLLHEGLGSVAMWRDFPDRLAAKSGCETVVYSRYGHGRSTTLGEPRRVDYMHREALEVLPEIRRQLGLDEPVLVGHSDGGSIALIHAGAGNWPVQGLVLLAPHVFVEDCTIAAIAAAREAWARGELKRLGRYHDDAGSMFRGWNDIWLDPDFRSWNIEEFLPGIACPLLLIQGEDDPYGTLAQLDAIEAGVASASIRRLVLPGCGHAPQRDCPAAVIGAIAEIVSEP